MELVLLHQRHADDGQHAQPDEGEPDAAEGLVKGGGDAVVPALGETMQLVYVVSDALDLVGGAGEVPEARPELVLEDVLVDGGAHGDADGAADGAEGVGGRGDGGLVRVVDGREAGEEGHG